MKTLATIEKGTTEYLARILEAGNNAPHYFVSGGIYYGIAMSSESFLKRAVQDTYPGIQFVSEEEFNQAVQEG